MIVLVLALAVVCGLLVTGGLTAGVVHRVRVKATLGTFACKIRVDNGAVDGIARRFRHRRSYALWVHDVLLLRRGLFLCGVMPLAVEAAKDGLARPARL